MAPTTGAPRLSKKRKLGKGKKKSWRAANVKELEDFLDDERRQLQTGGLVSERSDEKLFYLDTGKLQKTKSSGRPVSKEARRNRQLRSTALLQPSGHIKSVIEPLKENYKKGKRTQKILDSIKERAASQVRLASVQQTQNYLQEKITGKKQKRQLPEVTVDLWNDDELDTTKVKRPKKLLNKPSKLNATVVPHPGASINPSYEDHQDLLREALDTEEKIRKKALRTVNALILPNRQDVATEKTYLSEMAAGLVDDSESENDDKDGEDSDVKQSIIMPHRKTKRQRKAETKLGEQMRKKKAEADVKRRESMVFRIRNMKSDMKKQDLKEKEKSEIKLKLKEEEPYKTKRLGKLKFEEPALEIKLSEELVGSLREAKPEGNVMEDFYKGMMRRNVIEPRVKQKKKPKYKRKTYIKKTHKEITA